MNGPTLPGRWREPLSVIRSILLAFPAVYICALVAISAGGRAVNAAQNTGNIAAPADPQNYFPIAVPTNLPKGDTATPQPDGSVVVTNGRGDKFRIFKDKNNKTQVQTVSITTFAIGNNITIPSSNAATNPAANAPPAGSAATTTPTPAANAPPAGSAATTTPTPTANAAPAANSSAANPNFAAMSCSVSTAVVPQVRGEGLTEPIGDIILTCTPGSTPLTTNGGATPSTSLESLVANIVINVGGGGPGTPVIGENPPPTATVTSPSGQAATSPGIIFGNSIAFVDVRAALSPNAPFNVDIGNIQVSQPKKYHPLHTAVLLVDGVVVNIGGAPDEPSCGPTVSVSVSEATQAAMQKQNAICQPIPVASFSLSCPLASGPCAVTSLGIWDPVAQTWTSGPKFSEASSHAAGTGAANATPPSASSNGFHLEFNAHVGAGQVNGVGWGTTFGGDAALAFRLPGGAYFGPYVGLGYTTPATQQAFGSMTPGSTFGKIQVDSLDMPLGARLWSPKYHRFQFNFDGGALLDYARYSESEGSCSTSSCTTTFLSHFNKTQWGYVWGLAGAYDITRSMSVFGEFHRSGGLQFTQGTLRLDDQEDDIDWGIRYDFERPTY